MYDVAKNIDGENIDDKKQTMLDAHKQVNEEMKKYFLEYVTEPKAQLQDWRTSFPNLA